VLAAAMSSVTKTTVLCTDIGDTFRLILTTAQASMEGRMMDRCLTLVTETMPTRFTDECLDDYVGSLPPFRRSETLPKLSTLLEYLRQHALDAAVPGAEATEFTTEQYSCIDVAGATEASDVVVATEASTEMAGLRLQESFEGDTEGADWEEEGSCDLQAFNAFAHEDTVVLTKGRTTRLAQRRAAEAAAAQAHDARAPEANYDLLQGVECDDEGGGSREDSDDQASPGGQKYVYASEGDDDYDDDELDEIGDEVIDGVCESDEEEDEEGF
jgi:hypothetical protein